MHRGWGWRMSRAVLWLMALSVSFPVEAAGPAINQFETKDLEASPGDIQFQSQNAITFGQPARRSYDDGTGGTVFDENTVTKERYALEIQMGITDWFRTRLGLEFEKDRIDTPLSAAAAGAFENLSLSSVAVEGVFVLLPVKGNGVGLGILTEYDHAVGDGTDQFNVGPIVQIVNGKWSALANLLLVQHFGSPDRRGTEPPDRKRDFAYAAQVQYKASATWAVALEAYGTVDRAFGGGNRPEEQKAFGTFDQHRLGPVVYYQFPLDGMSARESRRERGVKSAAKDDDDQKAGGGDNDDEKGGSVSIGVGVLFGLNGNTPDETLKLSVEVNF